ncbi:MAG: hypothetical protein ABEK36_02250, partial [Candidatus Aenigmatarchaeota archaeon]
VGEPCDEVCEKKGYDGHSCVDSMDPTCVGTICQYNVNYVTKYNGKDAVCDNGKKCYCYREQTCYCENEYYDCENDGCQGPAAVFYDQPDLRGLNFSEDNTVEIPYLDIYEVGKDYNDVISSLIVKKGYKVSLYEHDDYDGDNITFYGPEKVNDLK